MVDDKIPFNKNNYFRHIMEIHSSYTDGFCRLCDKVVDPKQHRYKISSWCQEINHAYRSENIDIGRDDPECQSKFCCQDCYRNLGKVKEELKHKKKNPKSSKKFDYQMPPYKENMKVHLLSRCPCVLAAAAPAEKDDAQVDNVSDNDGDLIGVTPSKVRRLSGDPVESPSDKLSVREIRKRTPVRKHIKFRFEKGEVFPTGEVFTSSDSIPASRVRNLEVAKFFLCRVCGQYPMDAKVSKMCLHLYCTMCINNYKQGVNSSKCPPAYEDETNEDICIVPSKSEDIVNISSFVKEIHESIKIDCKNNHCNESFNVKEIKQHEENCRKRAFYHSEEKSLATTKSKPLLDDADEAINTVVQWSQSHKVSPCNFLFLLSND